MPAQDERRNVKTAAAIDQRRRQKQMFERQKQTRSDRVKLARMLGQDAADADEAAAPAPHAAPTEPHAAHVAHPAPHVDGAGGDGAPPQRSPGDGAPRAGRRGGGRRGSVDLEEDVWSGQVMMPDWMVEVPDALQDKWLVSPRPQGKRCLVLASAGKTVARLRTGRLLHAFQSVLPNGGPGRGGGRTGGQDATVLDCIYVDELGCFFICDVLCWKGHALVDCAAEFRFFWLQQKWAEEGGLPSQHHLQQNPHPLHLLPWFCCDPAGLESAYRSLAVPFTRDGLQFLHRDSHYEIGLTPLMLLWKDSACSTYLCEVYKDLDPAIQVVCLQVAENGNLLTHDEPQAVVASAGTELAATFARNKRGLALFKIAGISLSYPEETIGADEDVQGPPQVSVSNIEFFAPAAANRADADSLSKALFQQRLRVQPLSYEELQHNAALKQT